MHSNKKILVFKSSEDFGHKQTTNRYRAYSKSNNRTPQVIDKEIESQRGKRLMSGYEASSC